MFPFCPALGNGSGPSLCRQTSPQPDSGFRLCCQEAQPISPVCQACTQDMSTFWELTSCGHGTPATDVAVVRGVRGSGVVCCSSPAVPCLLLHRGERAAALRRVRLPSHALGARDVGLEAARKQWHEPSLLLSSLSAGLWSAQALGALQGNGMGVARGGASRAAAGVVGKCLFPDPPYLALMKQWAAVRTHCGLMREPPQMCPVPNSQGPWMLTIQGQAPGWASLPPTTRHVP